MRCPETNGECNNPDCETSGCAYGHPHDLDRETWEHHFSRRLALRLVEWNESQNQANKRTAKALDGWKGDWRRVYPARAADEYADSWLLAKMDES